MVKRIGFLFLAVCGIVWCQHVHAQDHICIISPSGGHCPGETVSFSLDCFGREYEVGGLNSVVWLVNGQAKDSKGIGSSSDPNPFGDFEYVFPGSGNYTIQAIIYSVNGPSPYDNPSATFEVMAEAPWPSLAIDKTSLCDHGSVTLSVINAASGFTYSWTSIPAGFSGTGTTITFDNITQDTDFKVTVNDCSSKYNDRSVSVLRTYNNLVLDADKSMYHVRKLLPSHAFISFEKLQIDNPLATVDLSGNGSYYTATDAGTYYLREHINDCWTSASAALVVPNDFNFVPTTPLIYQVYKPGYNTILLTNSDPEKNIMLKYANYYWVNGNNSTTILGKFSDGYKMSEEGIHYLRGQDIGTGTWGSTTAIQVQLLGDEGLTWIYTKTFDGTSNTVPFAEAKSYFDETGGGLQSQVKTHTLSRGNFVFTSVPLHDTYNRIVGSSLSAPIKSTDFKYTPTFLLATDGDIYSANDFDTESSLYQPLPVSADEGTVGWYYSRANDLEDNVPVTSFPYSRSEFYKDGSGEAKNSAGPGESHHLGQGHEFFSATFPIYQELDDYLAFRRSSQGINIPDNYGNAASLISEGVQSVVRDQNGKYAITIADRSGKIVFSARQGTMSDNALMVSNEVSFSNETVTDNYRNMLYFYILEPQTISITGYLYNYHSNSNSTGSTAPASKVTLAGSPDFIVEDVVNNVRKSLNQTFADPNDPMGKWPAGFYRIILPDYVPEHDNTGAEVYYDGAPYSSLTVRFNHFFNDVSYQFYDDAGRLKTSISPNGFKQLKDGVSSYANIDKTTYEYNHQGWLLAMNEPDAGRTEYIYRKDGKIRFSQNSQQRLDHHFSYTNYDQLGRPIESGEYVGPELQFLSLSGDVHYQALGEVGNTGSSNDNTLSAKKDWVKTFYNGDGENVSSVPGLSNFSQTFVRGAVSYSENANIQTWYSYDELGRVTSMAQKPKVLPLSFKVSYTYDFLGNVLSVSNLSYATNGSVADQFYHYYEYDADKRLYQAYTSTVPGGTRKLRATYEYYLHGPLKRIVLGDKLQGLDFVYNINGWLTQINHPDKTRDPGHDGSGSGVREDVFGMVLDYYESDLDNLYLAGAPMDVHDPLRRHHMPSNAYAATATNHQPLIRFPSPFQSESVPQVTPFSEYSVQNPKYKKMIGESQQYMSASDDGKDN